MVMSANHVYFAGAVLHSLNPCFAWQQCRAFEVKGAGENAVNGVYFEDLETSSDGVPYYYMGTGISDQ